VLTIAHSELNQLLRNRSVLVTSLVMPLAAAAYFIYNRDVFEQIGSLGYIGAVLVFTIAAFSLYATTVTTLAARRQNLFLKRLRTTTAGDPAILTGLVLPIGAISLVQIAAILAVFAALGDAPANAILVAVTVITSLVMMLAFGIATAGVTNSPEHAQVTTLPLSLGAIAVASWVGITGTESLAWVKRALPAGSATELIVVAWNGPVAGDDTLLHLGISLAWVLAATALATEVFRWEPRQ
jgi:ABC-2 type transport system permease protein